MAVHSPTISEPVTSATESQDANEVMREIIRKKIKAFNPYRRSRMLEIKANIAYLCGHQNIQVRNGQIEPLQSPYATAVVANKIWPAVMNDIAVATKAAPKFDVVPSGTDEDDKATAKAGEKILPYLQRVNDPHLHRRSVILWYDIAGVGWRKTYWKPNAKLLGYNPLPEQEGNNPDIGPMEPLFRGEVTVEHTPNPELVFDWRQKNLHNLKWIIQHKTITLAEVKSLLGSDVADSIPEKALQTKPEESFETEIMGDFSRLSKSLVAATPKPNESDLTRLDKHIDYYEFWHVPDKNMPQGAFAVGLGDIEKSSDFVLPVNGPYPKEQYPHEEIPFTPADPVSLDGISIGSVPRISLARPLQKEYNQIRSLILDDIDGMGNSVVFVPRGANVDRKKVTNLPGNYVEYDGPFKPQREPGVQIPAALFVHLENVRKDIDEIFAFHEPSKGIMPEGGPRSAIGLQTLQEADITQLSPVIRALDEADERVAHQALCLAIANYDERLIQIVGKDNQWVLQKISPDELKGKINVIVRTGSSLPLNKTLEQDKIVNAWQLGLLGNPENPAVKQMVLKGLDLGSMDQVLQDNAKHINIAQREFLMAEKLVMQMPEIPQGASENEIEALLSQYLYIPAPNDFDEDYVHLQEHSNFLLDKYWEYMASGQPVLQALAESMRAHNNLHAQRIQAQQILLLQLQNPKLAGNGSEQKTKND